MTTSDNMQKEYLWKGEDTQDHHGQEKHFTAIHNQQWCSMSASPFTASIYVKCFPPPDIWPSCSWNLAFPVVYFHWAFSFLESNDWVPLQILPLGCAVVYFYILWKLSGTNVFLCWKLTLDYCLSRKMHWPWYTALENHTLIIFCVLVTHVSDIWCHIGHHKSLTSALKSSMTGGVNFKTSLWSSSSTSCAVPNGADIYGEP